MTTEKQDFGQWAEDLAVWWLARQGYETIERRYRWSLGELDIIAQNREEILFIEVKARRNRRYGPAGTAVGRRALSRKKRLAQSYLAWHRYSVGKRKPRFAVIAIDKTGRGYKIKCLGE